MSDEFDSEDDYIYDKLNESLAEKAKQRNDVRHSNYALFFLTQFYSSILLTALTLV